MLHRDALLRSEVAACYYCLEKYAPSTIIEWCDGDNQNQTAICPRCGVDAVVGFNGPPDDVVEDYSRTRLRRGLSFSFGPEADVQFI